MFRVQIFASAMLSILLVSCGGGALSVANHRVGGFHPDGCAGYDQTKKNGEALLEYAQQLKLQGKISNEKYIDVDQEAGLYSQKLSTACRFFTAGDITFEQYQDAVEKADNNYRALRESLHAAAQK